MQTIPRTIHDILHRCGLSDTERHVYLAALSLGGASVQELAHESGTKRTTIYPIARRMVAEGLLSEYKTRHGVQYTALKPEKLGERLMQLERDLREVTPALKALASKENTEPVVRLYHGKEAYRDILRDTLTGYSHTICYFGSADELNKIITERFVQTQYIPERLKRKIVLQQIVRKDSFSQKLLARDKDELRFTRFLPPAAMFSSNKVIYHNKVAYLSSLQELVCLVVESEAIATMERAQFTTLWESV